MEAMIFAAGLGTRLQAETQNKPKALVQIGNKTLLQLAIEKLKKAGVSNIVINVHHFSEKIRAFVSDNDFGIPILISDETEELLDTGGGLKKAAPFFTGDKPIIIDNVDVLSSLNLSEVINRHKKKESLATLVVRKRETQRYLKFDNNQHLVGWINKKTGEKKISLAQSFDNSADMAFSGIQIIEPGLLKILPDLNKFSIIDVYLELAKTTKIMGYFDDSDVWMDVGKPAQLEEARLLFSTKF